MYHCSGSLNYSLNRIDKFVGWSIATFSKDKVLIIEKALDTIAK